MTSLTRRAVAMLINPAAEWRAIADERRDIGLLYRTYVAPLAAVPAVSLLLGLLIAGGRFLGTAGIVTAISAALTGYALTLASVLLAGAIIARMGPRFGSIGSTARAVTLVAYASTPMWLAGVFYASLLLSRLVILGAIGAIYLFYVGLSPMLKTPIEQRVPFTVACALAMLVVNIALRAAVSVASVPYYGF